jgi:nitrite reductase/ring-hydroxylating ferredoxin subunit
MHLIKLNKILHYQGGWNVSAVNFKACLKEKDLKEGQMRHVQVSGKSILLVKQGSQIFAISNICPHEGCSLDKGILHEYSVMCPCHGWRFDVRNGQFAENKLTTLATYRCKIENGKIYVGVAGARSLFS